MKHLIPWRKRQERDLPANREHPLEALHRQMNELFDDFFDDFETARLPSLRGEGLGDVPVRFDVAETEEAVHVTAELPGMDEKDIEVTLDRNALTVKGEKKQEREERKKNYYFSERTFGQFQRLIPLPSGIEPDKAKAQFKKGVLTISLPKSAAVKSEGRRIAISAE